MAVMVDEWLARAVGSIRLTPPRQQSGLPIHHRGFLHTTLAWGPVGSLSVTMKPLLAVEVSNGVGHDLLVSGLTINEIHEKGRNTRWWGSKQTILSESRSSYGSTVHVLLDRLGEKG